MDLGIYNMAESSLMLEKELRKYEFRRFDKIRSNVKIRPFDIILHSSNQLPDFGRFSGLKVFFCVIFIRKK